jgi:hypothetical protein
MKIFTWYNMQSLADWSAGMAFGVAEDTEEAIQAIIKDMDDSEDAAWIESELREKEPTIYDPPFGHRERGSA